VRHVLARVGRDPREAALGNESEAGRQRLKVVAPNANTPSRAIGRNYNVRGHSQRGRERAKGPQRGAKSGGEAGIGEVGGDRNVRVVVCCVRRQLQCRARQAGARRKKEGDK
jgi:hypothetical protein